MYAQDEPAAPPAEKESAAPVDDFSDMPKKRKKKKEIPMDFVSGLAWRKLYRGC